MLKYKAVRDKVPIDEKELVKFPDELYLYLLREKLEEEIREYKNGFNVEELGDIIEVCYRIAELQGIHNNLLNSKINDKHLAKGGFAFNSVWVKKENNGVFYE